MKTLPLLTIGNPKTQKGVALGYLTAILHLSPERSAGVGNVCPFASAGCIATCLNTAGRGGIFKKGETTNVIQNARQRKTREFFQSRFMFVAQLHSEIAKFSRTAERKGLLPAIRLNGTSDLRFDVFARQLFADFPKVNFYDYTKDLGKVRDFISGKTPSNYHVTFSRSETTAVATLNDILRAGVSVAVPYRGSMAGLPEALNLAPDAWTYVVDGDASDLRFLDTPGSIVALSAKGKAKRDMSGFVVTVRGGK